MYLAMRLWTLVEEGTTKEQVDRSTILKEANSIIKAGQLSRSDPYHLPSKIRTSDLSSGCKKVTTIWSITSLPSLNQIFAPESLAVGHNTTTSGISSGQWRLQRQGSFFVKLDNLKCIAAFRQRTGASIWVIDRKTGLPFKPLCALWLITQKKKKF